MTRIENPSSRWASGDSLSHARGSIRISSAASKTFRAGAIPSFAWNVGGSTYSLGDSLYFFSEKI
jgi:hypothetical protein